MLQRWTDPEFRVASYDYHFRHTYFGGESIPVHWPNLGPGIMATYVGSTPTFDERTTWFGPAIFDWSRDRDKVRFDPNSEWWQVTRNLTRAAVEAV